jgi:hypothetical protein
MDSLEDLPTEIILDIFYSCAGINDVLNLSATCLRFRQIYTSSRRLPILERAVDAQFGPIHELTQLLTHNDSQPAHVIRDAPFTQALLEQMVRAGHVAESWANIYPGKKWKTNYEDRRLLREEERRRFRRALYRLWLYGRAFHNAQHLREHRMSRNTVLRRAQLLHNWRTTDLAEMADVHAVLRDVVHSNVCPSNGTIARKFRKRFPDNEHRHQLLFNIHLNYPPPSTPPSSMTGSSPFFQQSQMQQDQSPPYNPFNNPTPFSSYSAGSTNNRTRYSKYMATPTHEPGLEGWGDDIPHYYVVEDMLKLDPAQILWLRDHAPLKSQVQMYVKCLGDWFENNGETWGQTLEWVLGERGVPVQELMCDIEEGKAGVALVEE